MKQLIKIFFSVLFLTTVLVFSVRYFLVQKINQNNLSQELKDLIESHYIDSSVILKGFRYDVSSELMFHLDLLEILDKRSGMSFVKLDNLEMKVPLISIFTNKGTINTSVDKIEYNYIGSEHLLDFTANPGQPSITNFPSFILNSRHNLRVKELFYDQYLLGRLNLKNINVLKTTAFEVKKRFRNSEYLSGDLRLIGEISLNDLFSTGKFNTFSSFSFKNIQLKKSQSDKAYSGKGNFESKGKLNQLTSDLKVVSPDFFELSGKVLVDAQNIELTNLSGTFEDARLFPHVPQTDLSYQGKIKINRKTFKTKTNLSFKNLKSIESDVFISEIDGAVVDKELSFKVVAIGLSGEVEGLFKSSFDLRNIVESNPVLDNIEWTIKAKDLDFKNFKFGEFLGNEQRFKNSDYPDFKLNLALSNGLIREQVFQTEIRAKKNGDIFSVDKFSLKDTSGSIKGNLSIKGDDNTLNLSSNLKNMELDFLKAIMGNRDIHVRGKFSGSVVSVPENGQNITKLDLKGTDGEIMGLFEILQLKKIFDVATENQANESIESEDFRKFNELTLQLSIGTDTLVMEKISLTNRSALSLLSAEGTVFLKDGPSRIMGIASKNDVTVDFLLEGNSIFFTPNIAYTEQKLQKVEIR